MRGGKSSRSRKAWEEFLNARGTHVPAPAEPELSRPAPKVRLKAAPSKLELELHGHLKLLGLEPVPQYRMPESDRRWRFDFAFPAERVLVDVDGGIFAAENGEEAGRHARGMGRCNDMEKRNAAAELGYLVLSYGPPHVRSGEAAQQISRIVTSRRPDKSKPTDR